MLPTHGYADFCCRWSPVLSALHETERSHSGRWSLLCGIICISHVFMYDHSRRTRYVLNSEERFQQPQALRARRVLKPMKM
eukprot:3223222-Pleurochrysis_carterae.AAC.1